MDAVTLALAKKYAKKTLSGIGPIKGEPGDAGPEGPKGQTGDAGAKGPKGTDGEKGPTGDAGPKGPKGDTGDVGPTGPAGKNGADGKPGIDGKKGATGAIGPQGAQGPQCKNGQQGEPFLIKKVYDTVSSMNAGYATDGIAVGELVAISSGTEAGYLYKKGATKYDFFYDIGQVNGLAGPAGPAGPDGPVGDKGIQGVDGSKGETGDKGPDGTKGPKGDTGDTGPKGAKGDTGAAGAQGPKGETGYAGPKGPSGDSGAAGPKGEPGDEGAPVTINGQATKTIKAGSNITIDKTGKILTINATGSGGGTGGMYPVVVIITEPATAGVTFTMANGKSTFTGTTDSTGTVEIEFDDIGNWMISTNGASQTLYADSVKIYNVTFKLTAIYGVEWDGTATTKWTRTDAAETFTDPVPYVAGATSYGSPFDNISPWKDMTIEERTGGTMVKIPKFYYKLEHKGNGLKIQISESEFDGAIVSPAHTDRGDGKGERDVVYIGRYHCSEADYKSKPTHYPKNNITRATARAAIHSLGSNIWQSDFLMRFTIWLLYLVEFADWNSRERIGCGCGNNSSIEVMGYTDSMPYHTGTTQGSRTTYGLGTQYRNIEGLWDNVYDWCDGCYNDSNGINIIINPENFSDDSSGTSIGTPTSGFPSKFTVAVVNRVILFIPNESYGSDSTYSCGAWYFSQSGPIVLVGGYYKNYNNINMFFVSYSFKSEAVDFVGCRIQELP